MQIEEFLMKLQKSIIDVEGSLECACTSACSVAAKFFKIDVIQGEYNGEDHDWISYNGIQYDVTASQFGGASLQSTQPNNKWSAMDGERIITRTIHHSDLNIKGCCDEKMITEHLLELGASFHNEE